MAISSRKRRGFSAQQRQDYLARFGRSGLSAAAFCRREELNQATFSLWRRAARSVAPAFAEVRVSAPAPAPSVGAAVLLLPRGTRVEVTLGGDAAWHGLGLLLKSLQS